MVLTWTGFVVRRALSKWTVSSSVRSQDNLCSLHPLGFSASSCGARDASTQPCPPCSFGESTRYMQVWSQAHSQLLWSCIQGWWCRCVDRMGCRWVDRVHSRLIGWAAMVLGRRGYWTGCRYAGGRCRCEMALASHSLECLLVPTYRKTSTRRHRRPSLLGPILLQSQSRQPIFPHHSTLIGTAAVPPPVPIPCLNEPRWCPSQARKARTFSYIRLDLASS